MNGVMGRANDPRMKQALILVSAYGRSQPAVAAGGAMDSCAAALVDPVAVCVLRLRHHWTGHHGL